MTKGEKGKIGVLLVDNVSPLLTDEQLYSYFKGVENVTEVHITNNSHNPNVNRYCWVNVKDTPKTLCQLDNTKICNCTLSVRLMGYFYPCQ